MHKPFREFHLFALLNEFEKNQLPLDLCIHLYFRKNKALGSKDRAFIAETIYKLVRWKTLLDHFSKSPYSWEKRYEVFRNNSLESLLSTPDLPSHIAVSFPDWIYEKWVQEYGESLTRELCMVSNTQAPATIRANILKTTRDDLFNALSSKFDVKKTLQSPYGIVFNKRINFFELPEFINGLFEVQDEGSQLLAELINPSPNDQILDYCAGAGGKTLAFGPKLLNKGQIYLHDVRKSALQDAKKRVKRAGLQNIQILDDENPALKKLKKKMDWILVDAPCSGTGTLRRNPDMKWKLTPEDLHRLIGLQRHIFEKALSFLANTGNIVYATCSLFNEENEQQTDHFLKTYSLEMVGPPLKILPTLDGPDGFYAAVLKKC